MRRFVFFLFLSVVRSVPLDLNSQDGASKDFQPVGQDGVASDFQPVPINPVDNVIQNGVNNGTLLSGQLFKTVKRYHCSLGRNEQTRVLLYGANGWSFPRQDVNLTLSYPATNSEVDDAEEYVISGYEIIMFTDGSDSSGLITAGGLMRESITLNFIMSSITMLSYEFWLYGIPASQVTSTYYVNHQVC